MKLGKIFKKRFTFLHIYSIYGLIVLVIIALAINYFAKNDANLNELYLKALAGGDIRYVTYYYSSGYIRVLAVTLVLLYLAVNTVYVLIYRYFLSTQPITISQHGKKVLVELPKNRYQSYLQVLGDLIVTSKSAITPLLQEQQLVAVMQKNMITFDLSFLPTGNYTVDRLDFYIKEPLGLLSALSSREELGASILLDSDILMENSAFDTTSFTNDAMETQYMTEANESYFSTREYQKGDPMKRIHWRNTAKSHKVMVRIPEERTVKNSNLTVVINMYLLHPQLLNQSETVGRYLDVVLASLDKLLKLPYNSVTILINGGATQELKEVNTYNSDKIREILLSAAVSQSTKTLQQFLADKNLGEAIIFTLSSDVPGITLAPVYILKQSAFIAKSMRERINDFLHSKNRELQAVSIPGYLAKLNLITHLKKSAAKRKLLTQIKRNEGSTHPNWRYL
jgi:hypothetical protein